MGDEQAEQRVDLAEHPGTRVVQGVDLDLLDATLDEIRPTLQADGGDMRFHGIDEQGIVSIELTGACGTCIRCSPTSRCTAPPPPEAEAQAQESVPCTTTRSSSAPA